MTIISHWNFNLALVWLWLFASAVRCQTADMSKFKSYIDLETCTRTPYAWFKFERIKSIFFLETQTGVFYQSKDSPPEFKHIIFLNNESKIQQNQPIYHLNLKNSRLQPLFSSLHMKLFDKYLNHSKVVYCQDLDDENTIWIFDGGKSTNQLLVNNYKNIGTFEQGKMVDGTIEKGTIALIDRTESMEKINRQLEVPTTFMNNQKYTYQTGWLNMEQATIRMEHTYYFGFNHDLDHIYFLKHLKLQSKIPSFLHASTVVRVNHWNVFRGYGYVYMFAGDWVFVFPHLNLTKELMHLKNPSVLGASMMVMHRNTLFRCSDSLPEGKIPVPTYPKAKFTVYAAELSKEDEDTIKDKEEKNKDKGKDFSMEMIGGGVGLLIMILILLIVVCVCKRHKKRNKKRLSKLSITGSTNSSPNRTNSYQTSSMTPVAKYGSGTVLKYTKIADKYKSSNMGRSKTKVSNNQSGRRSAQSGTPAFRNRSGNNQSGGLSLSNTGTTSQFNSVLNGGETSAAGSVPTSVIISKNESNLNGPIGGGGGGSQFYKNNSNYVTSAFSDPKINSIHSLSLNGPSNISRTSHVPSNKVGKKSSIHSKAK